MQRASEAYWTLLETFRLLALSTIQVYVSTLKLHFTATGLSSAHGAQVWLVRGNRLRARPQNLRVLQIVLNFIVTCQPECVS